ncbi:MAG TPA: PilT/PilU family type 4a pilus ATPase, partial [Acidimicrobiales bacterium]|nr:PilT/PilU family type 4a pilus ATPase [Acidimicrobiales bacterium]
MSPSAATRAEWARRLAQSLVSDGYASDAAVAPVLDEATTEGSSFPALLIARDVTSQEVVLGLMSQLTRLPVVDLDRDRPSDQALAATPVEVAKQFGAVGYRLDGDQLTMAFGDPPDADDVRTLSTLVGHAVVPALANPIAIDRLLAASVPAPPPPAADGAGPATNGAPTNGAASNAAPTNGASTNGVPTNGAGSNGALGAHGNNPGALAVHDSDDVPMHLDDLLRYAVSVGASDLHVTAGLPACIRLNGAIRPIEGCPPLENETIRDMVFGILPQSLRERFEADKELDTSHSIVDVGRFRLNVFQQRGTVAAALRSIPHEIPAFEVLGVPESIRAFTDMRRGLVLVTGPTGSGKSTTLASLVDIINRSKPLHIITIEDPIEFLHTHKRAMVNQREVGQDTASFSEALRRVLREDPDVILVGEMRDLETISMALTAAETGHLVFGTLHTQDAPQTIDRIIDVFPNNQQEQVRTMLSGALEGVVTQQLLLNADGNGRLACCEVMICTPAIRNLVRSAKTHQIYSLMQTGGQYGMQTMDQGLAKLVKQGRITEAGAFDRCRNEE